jgi:putative redox protein
MPTSKIIYLGELRTEATHLQSGTSIITDAPTDNNGRGEAFSPTDLVATALGSCAMTIMGISARNDGIDLTGSSIEITKIMSIDTPRRIVRVDINFNMLSPQPLTEAQQAKLIRAAHTCPVAKSLHTDIEQNMVFHWATLA